MPSSAIKVPSLLEELEKGNVASTTYYNAGIALYCLGHKKEAMQGFSKAIKAEIGGKAGYKFLLNACLGYINHVEGYTSIALDYYQKAATFAESAIAEDQALLWELRSCILNGRRQYSEAIVESTMAITLKPSARAHASKAFSLAQSGIYLFYSKGDFNRSNYPKS